MNLMNEKKKNDAHQIFYYNILVKHFFYHEKYVVPLFYLIKLIKLYLNCYEFKI